MSEGTEICPSGRGEPPPTPTPDGFLDLPSLKLTQQWIGAFLSVNYDSSSLLPEVHAWRKLLKTESKGMFLPLQDHLGCRNSAEMTTQYVTE